MDCLHVCATVLITTVSLWHRGACLPPHHAAEKTEVQSRSWTQASLFPNNWESRWPSGYVWRYFAYDNCWVLLLLVREGFWPKLSTTEKCPQTPLLSIANRWWTRHNSLENFFTLNQNFSPPWRDMSLLHPLLFKVQTQKNRILSVARCTLSMCSLFLFRCTNIYDSRIKHFKPQ